MTVTSNALWMALGFFGQAMFSMRFIIQWVASERRRKSIIPLHFWYFSIFGGLALLAYAIYRLDPVFILGQSFGLLVYVRNLFLLRREGKQARSTLPPE